MADVALRPGSVIDERFRLKRLLGSGGCGAVWLAHDHAQGGAELVLKILHAHFDKFSQGIRQLEREAELLAQLAHPNIAKPITFSAKGQHTYLAMEYVDGRSLDQEIGAHTKAREHFGRAELARVFEEMASAIAHAHSRTIIHRDLKPQNILVSRRDGELFVKVLDFGIAKLVEGNLFDATTFGRRLGSMFYMSPEQCQGEPADVRSDVFALGAILFEMVTLRRAWVWDQSGQPLRAFEAPVPADGSNPLSAVLLRVSSAERPQPRRWRPELPEGFDALIARAMAIDPGERFRDVAELLAEFHAVVDEMGETSPRRAKTTRERLEPVRRSLTPTLEPRPSRLAAPMGSNEVQDSAMETGAELAETLRKVRRRPSNAVESSISRHRPRRATRELEAAMATSASAALATRVDEPVFRPPPYAGPRIEADTEIATELAETRLSGGTASSQPGHESSESQPGFGVGYDSGRRDDESDRIVSDPSKVLSAPPRGVYPTREIERPRAFRNEPPPRPTSPKVVVEDSAPPPRPRPRLPARAETLTSMRGPKLVVVGVVGMLGAFLVGILLARWAAGAMQPDSVRRVSFAGRGAVDEAALERYAHLDALLESAKEQPKDTGRLLALRDGIMLAADELPSEEERTQVKRAAGSSASAADLLGMARCIDRLRQSSGTRPTGGGPR